MAASRKIVDLRNFLAERFPSLALATTSHLKTEIDALDQILGGGLPKGSITELITPQFSAGSASLIHALLQSTQRSRQLVALIDGRDSFEPCGADNLEHLLWVRCTNAQETVKAADLLLRDGNFPLVMVDLVLNSAPELRKIPQTNWYRLQRLVESVPTACLILTRYSLVSSAQLKIVLKNSWQLESLESEDVISPLQFSIQRSHLRQAIPN